jgi:hypothetical protein
MSAAQDTESLEEENDSNDERKNCGDMYLEPDSPAIPEPEASITRKRE